MKKLVLLLMIVSINFSFATTNYSDQVKSNINEVTSVNAIDRINFNFSDLESLQKFDFNSFLKQSGLEDGQCTVSVTVTVYEVSATFSVTADTCAEAGAGAVQAATAFVKEIMKIE
ncbi:MAG: hypothetical protein GXO49_07140 [Chlorobi bacterium]|nr:hypothetical protein [Chlorobiota bacterium]